MKSLFAVVLFVLSSSVFAECSVFSNREDQLTNPFIVVENDVALEIFLNYPATFTVATVRAYHRESGYALVFERTDDASGFNFDAVAGSAYDIEVEYSNLGFESRCFVTAWQTM